jgi:hypothetical protein
MNSNLKDYLSKLNDYSNGNSLKALILYYQVDSTHYHNTILSKMIAYWTNVNHSKSNNPIVYRFCALTLSSNNLYSLIQGIIH